MVYSRCCVAFFVADACPFAVRFCAGDLGATISHGEIYVSPGAARRAWELSQSCDTLRMLRTRRGAENGRKLPGRSVRPEVEPLQLAMERGAADAERLGRRRYIALCAQQRALQDAALDVAEMLDRIGPAEQVRRRNRTERALRCETQG